MHVQEKFRVLIVLSASRLHATVRMLIPVHPFLIAAATLSPAFLKVIGELGEEIHQ